ncbi:MAG: AraC family transcriptional regulator [Xanthomonadales bacterium]|nr:AraC family transcriptional regulator [Xanthomonadales bacterium]
MALVAATPARQMRPDIVRRLHQARQFIEDNFDSPICLDDMAASAFMSSAHFLRQFKQQFSITPYQYLTHCRLQAAQKLLRNTEIAITDVVFASGFGNRSAFSRLFKERYGVSPMEFRRLHPSHRRRNRTGFS